MARRALSLDAVTPTSYTATATNSQKENMTISEIADALVRDAERLIADEGRVNLVNDEARSALSLRATALMDQVAAQRGIEQVGPVWDLVHRYRSARGRESFSIATEFDRVRRDTPMAWTDEAIALSCMVVANATSPEQLILQIQMVTGAIDGGDVLRESQAKIGRAWYGED